MSRRQRRHRITSSSLLEPAPDYGPGFRRVNARQVPTAIGAADGLVLAEIADVEKPGQRGAVTRVALREDPLWNILGAERLGDGRMGWPNPAHAAWHYAAEKLRDDSAVADGLHTEYRLLSVFGSEPGTPTQAMLDAQKRCRQAWLAIRGPENDDWIADAVRNIVLGRAALVATARHQRCHYYTTRDRLTEGLRRLADYYGLD